jgi:hypothetical protein
MSLKEKLEKARNTAPTDWLTEGMTNGEMLMTMFPQINVIKSIAYPDSYYVSFPDFVGVYILKCWWNAPYKPQEGVEE